MRAKRILVTIAALAAMIAVGLLAYRLEAPRGPALCQVCGRMIPRQTAFRFETASGTINACCPACAIHFMLQAASATRKTWATDFNSGRMIPAESAYYDEGGDVAYCTAHTPLVERGAEGVSERVYDRCLPALVAFSTLEEADAYRNLHGGRIRTYDDVRADLARQ